MSNALTKQEFQDALPPSHKKSVSDKLIAQVNKVLTDPAAADSLRENILGYTQVIKEGRFKVESYLAAVHYVSYKLLGCTNQDAYIKTFPGKYKKFLQRGTSAKDISAYASAYNKTKLVNLIYEQTLVPISVLNAPMLQDALNVQADLMINANSEMVRTTAANSIINALKRDDPTKKIELDIGVKTQSVTEELRDATLALVEEQKKAMKGGLHTAKQVAESSITVKNSENQDDVIDS